MLSFSQCLAAGLLSEGRREYMAKHGSEPGAAETVDGFWKIKSRARPPLNDIDYWIKRPFAELKAFVDGFDTRKRSERRSDEHAAKAAAAGAVRLGAAGGYEAWYVPSYEAAVELGRFYKNVSAQWCISTENPTYFNDDYSVSEFIFMVAEDPSSAADPALAKIAIEYSDHPPSSRYEVWDLEDSEIGLSSRWMDSGLRPYADMWVEDARKRGLNRPAFELGRAEKVAADPEWVKSHLFTTYCVTAVPGVPPPHKEGGNWVVRVSFDALDDVVNEKHRDAVSLKSVKAILAGEISGVIDFFRPDPSYDLPDQTTRGFDKIRPCGLKWADVARIAAGEEVDCPSKVYGLVQEMLADDIGGGVGYAQAVADAEESGAAAEARDDVVTELADAGVDGVEWADGMNAHVLVCKYGPDDVKKMAAAAIALGSEKHSPLEYVLYDLKYREIDKVTVTEPYGGWSDCDMDYLSGELARFANTLAARAQRVVDSDGQAYFDFDRDYLDNPGNTPTDRLNEANSAGLGFERRVAASVNDWLGANGLAARFKARRFRPRGSSDRSEDFPDVAVADSEGGRFFIECKEDGRAHLFNARLELTPSLGLRPAGGRLASAGDGAAETLARELEATPGFRAFREFMSSPCAELDGAVPADVWFASARPRSALVRRLVSRYNRLVRSGATESDCKEFDPSRLRESTLQQLAVALAWRLSGAGRTWDVCRLDGADLGPAVRSHYADGMSEPARYLQVGDRLFVLDARENPLGLKGVPEFPRSLRGTLSLKFTPRFGTGAMYLAPRSEAKEWPESPFSFVDRERWPKA